MALPRTCWGSDCWGGLAVDVIAPAADLHVIAAGSNSRLQRTAFVRCEVLPATSRGFASIYAWWLLWHPVSPWRAVWAAAETHAVVQTDEERREMTLTRGAQMSCLTTPNPSYREARADRRCRAPVELPEDLDTIVHVSKMKDLYDEVLAIPALAALPAWGEQGLVELRRALLHGLHGADAQRVLLTIASGDSLLNLSAMQIPTDWFKMCALEHIDNLAPEAALMVRELMQVQLTDRTVRDRLIHNLSFELMFASSQPQTHTTADYFFSLFTDTQLQLNPELLGKFSNLLDSTETREEDIQQFLFAHPYFLIHWRSKYAASTSSEASSLQTLCSSELITSTCSLKSSAAPIRFSRAKAFCTPN